MRSLALPLLCGLLSAVLTGCPEGTCDSDLMCTETQQCNRLTRQCEPKSFPGRQACGDDGECPAPRACVDGFCVFAPDCLHVGGSWEAWQVGPGLPDGGHQGVLDLVQDGCAVSRGASGGVAFETTVDRAGNLSEFSPSPFSGAPGGCTGAFGGNETLRIQCGNPAAPLTFHLYARPVQPEGEALEHFGRQVEPVRCEPDAGCAGAAACVPNVQNAVPACAP